MVGLDNAGLGRSALDVRRADAGLDWAIEHTWVQWPAVLNRSPHLHVALQRWRILPDASPHLVMSRARHALGQTRDRISVVGPRSRFAELDQTPRLFSVGVRLRPGVLPPLAGVDASTWRDRACDATSVFGSSAERLRRRVAGEESPEQIRRHLVAFVARGLKDASRDWRVRATAHALALGSFRPTADTLARRMGVAPRTLRSVLAREVGLGLKMYLRIQRLHAAIHSALDPRPVRWSRIAAHVGFADQAHLIREFRALVGETPTRFMARGSALCGADSFNPPGLRAARIGRIQPLETASTSEVP